MTIFKISTSLSLFVLAFHGTVIKFKGKHNFGTLDAVKMLKLDSRDYLHSSVDSTEAAILIFTSIDVKKPAKIHRVSSLISQSQCLHSPPWHFGDQRNCLLYRNYTYVKRIIILTINQIYLLLSLINLILHYSRRSYICLNSYKLSCPYHWMSDRCYLFTDWLHTEYWRKFLTIRTRLDWDKWYSNII